MVKISIITVVKNDVHNIGKTIKSVLSQNYKDYEYIIIDGNSVDGTSRIIEQYKKKLIYIKGKDKSIYDALNKGIKFARGNYIGIIHSGDTYKNNHILYSISKDLVSEDLVSYNMDYIKKNKIIRKWNLKLNKLTQFNFFYIAHPTLFIKRAIFKRRKYSLKYKIASDTDFLCYLSKKSNLKYKYCNKTIMRCLYGGVSTSGSFFLKKFKEDLDIFFNHFGFKGIFLLIFKILIKIKSFII